MGLVVKKAGIHAAIQDLGRKGFLSMGVSSSGVMDPLAMRSANALLGNEPNAAVLEVLLQGPQFEVKKPCLVAVVGTLLANETPETSQFPISINGIGVPMGEALWLQAGDLFEIGMARFGARCWVAFSGGICVEPVLGSCSTHVKTKIGGREGRGLMAGDHIPLGTANFKYFGNQLFSARQAKLWFSETRFRNNASTLPVIPGPQVERFEEESLKTFYNTPYRLTQQSDRMGYRLEGEPLVYKQDEKPDLLSEPNVIGAIQIPGDGKPLILLQDAGTTGGYAKVAVVPKAFLRNLSQMRPDDQVQFTPVCVETAQSQLLQQEKSIREIEQQLNAYEGFKGVPYRIAINQKYYHVDLVEITEE